MRNVRHVLRPLATFPAVSFQNHAKGVQVGSFKRVLNLYHGQYTSHVNFSSSFLLNNLSANSIVDAAETSNPPTTAASHSDPAVLEENTNPKNKKKFQFNTAKTKEAHLKRFNNALIKGTAQITFS